MNNKDVSSKIFFVITVFFLIINFCMNNFLKMPIVNVPKYNMKKLVSDWKFCYKENVVDNISIPHKENVKKNELFSYKNYFPKDYSNGNILAIKSRKQNIKLKCEGELLVDCSNYDSVTVRATLDKFWIFYKIPENLLGKEFELEMSSSSKDGSGYISDVYLIYEGSPLYVILKGKWFSFLILMSNLTMNIIVFGISVFLYKKNNDKDMIYLSICLFIINIWILAESELLIMFTGQTYVLSRTHYNIMNLGCVSIIMWLDEIEHDFKNKTIYIKYFIFVYSIALFILSTLNILNSSLYWLCVIFILALIFIIYIKIYYLELFKKKKKKYFFKFIVFSVIVASFILEAITFYFFKYKIPQSIFLEAGVLISIVFSFINYYNIIKNTKNLELEKAYLSKIAYTDNLTGAYNRTAFNEDILAFKDGKEYILINLDCNNLKYVNDNFGHISGDMLIKDAFDCVNFTFGRFGKCYRVGGDEFICLIEVDTKFDFYDVKEKFYNRVDYVNSNREYDFSISLGYISFIYSYDVSIDDILKEADELMYIDKKKYKKLR